MPLPSWTYDEYAALARFVDEHGLAMDSRGGTGAPPGCSKDRFQQLFLEFQAEVYLLLR